MPGLRETLARPSGDRSNLKEILEAATPGPWSKSQRWMAVGHAGRDIGICSTWGENGHANARLIALAPELAALVLDMGEELRIWQKNYGRDDEETNALLARLDRIGKEQTDGPTE